MDRAVQLGSYKLVADVDVDDKLVVVDNKLVDYGDNSHDPIYLHHDHDRDVMVSRALVDAKDYWVGLP